MAEEKVPTVVEPTPTEDRFKDDPKYLAMASQLAKLQKEDTDRKEAATNVAKQNEMDKAKAEGRWADAEKLHTEALTALETKHTAELLERDLGLEMAQVGFSNSNFVKGAIAGYDSGEFPTVKDYVKSLADDAENKPYLSTVKNVPAPPGKPGFGSGDIMNLERYRALQTSSDEKERKSAEKYLDDYYIKHNALPDFLKSR